MMLNRDDLQFLLQLLNAAEPCDKHGVEPMEICSECREKWSISCGVCQVISCQCTNDE